MGRQRHARNGWRNDAVQNVEDVVAVVQREPEPDAYGEEWRAISSTRLSEGGHASNL